MWEIIGGLVADGVTIFLTTQYLDEADHLADRIAILDHGRVIAEGTSAELKRLVPGGHLRLTFFDEAAVDVAASALGGGQRDDDAMSLTVPSDGGVASLRSVLDRLDEVSVDVDELSIRTPDLDDVFFALTSRDTPLEAMS
jgi:ABC-2 type transport system ATP-binding protein